jgi:hypothetical protein
MSPKLMPIEKSPVACTEEAFQSALIEWRRDKGPTSNSAKITAHPAFRRIVAMGPEAVPYILREVKREPSLLVMALREITGHNPVTQESRGDLRAMAKAWVEWGEKSGVS